MRALLRRGGLLALGMMAPVVLRGQSNYATPYTFTTLAGTISSAGAADGTGTSARFYRPNSVAMDGAGNLYIADFGNSTIRKISSGGVVTTLAGTAGLSGSADGTGSAARFSAPMGVAVDGVGNVYVSDVGTNTIRKITSGGVVTTLAGSAGTFGSSDGTGSAARFGFPTGVAVDSAGIVYVADSSNNTIRKITSGGMVTTLAGTAGISGSADGIGSAARFDSPQGVAADSLGNIYVTDSNNNTIRKITSSGLVTTVAGSVGHRGSIDGLGTIAAFNGPAGVGVDNMNNVYIADTINHTIRKISSSGAVMTLAGSALLSGSADGSVNAARFKFPTGVVADGLGSVYVADSVNNTIRKVTSAGAVTTFAGTAVGPGSVDGTGSAALFNKPSSVAVDSVGNVYVADANNYTIRKIANGGVVTTLAGLPGNQGSDDGTGDAARFLAPTNVGVDSAGAVYVADFSTIRKITSGGVVTTLAGSAVSSGSADGTGNAARFNRPQGVAVDTAGNIYVADFGNFTIRKISSGAVVTTLAGTAGAQGWADGTGGAARFNAPGRIAVDSAGNVYVTDWLTIRKITSAGVVTTLAGAADSSGSADGTGNAARFSYAAGLAVDAAGNVYVADTDNNTIRKITSGGVVTTLGGTPGLQGSADETGSAARFHTPLGLAVDSAGNVYIADSANHTIRWGALTKPILTSATLAAGNVGQNFAYTATFSNVLAGPYLASGLPDGLAINPSNGSISGSPTAAGTFPVTLGATNGAGTGAAIMTIVVGDASPANIASHVVTSGGYVPGETVTIANTLVYTATSTSLVWQVLLPAGWSFASSLGDDGSVKPTVGATGMAEWSWPVVPPSPVTFSYTLNVPGGTNGDAVLVALVSIVQSGATLSLLGQPDPLIVHDATARHSTDTNGNSRISLFELTRSIELYNTRNGTTRTGCYAVATAASEDGFAPEPTRTGNVSVTLSRYHTADSNHDGKLSLFELTRVIELYNYRSGTTRTGEYHVRAGSEDGFAPGP